MSSGLLILACVIFTVCRASATTDYDNKYIESKDYEYYLQKTKSNAAKTCATQELAAYGLRADINSQSDPNPICPGIQGNCCGAGDQERIYKYWDADDRHQSGYHTAFLTMNRYILGNVKNYQRIASHIIATSQKLKFQGKTQPTGGDQSGPTPQTDDGKPYDFEFHPKCEEAAKKFIDLDFVDREKAQNFYDSLNRRANFMQDARRGFYCTLCNAKAKEYISTFRIGITSRLWYSRDFCEMMYSHTFAAVYGIYKSYNPFLKYLLQMLTCVKPRGNGSSNSQNNNGQNDSNGARPQVVVNIRPISVDVDLKVKNPFTDKKLPEAVRRMLDNPLHVTSKFWMEVCYNSDPTGFFFGAKCMGFCENFEMTKASPLLDGDIEAMQRVYSTLTEYEFALESPMSNIFSDDVLALKKNVNAQVAYLKGNYNFYRSLNTQINFSKYKIVFSLIFKGHNPMLLSKGTTLKFKYKAASRWTLLAALLVALLAPHI